MSGRALQSHRRAVRLPALLLALVTVGAACSGGTATSAPGVVLTETIETTERPAVVGPAHRSTATRTPTSVAPSTSSSTTTSAPEVVPATTTTTTTTPTTTSAPDIITIDTTRDGTGLVPPPSNPEPVDAPPPTLPPVTVSPADPMFPATNAAFDALARNNPAASLTVRRDGGVALARASGVTAGGSPATSDSPMVVASVSKLVTAFTLARLQQQGLIEVTAPVPWQQAGLAPHPAWADVTMRELLDHTSGMPVVRSSWFDGGGDCPSHLASLLSQPPQVHRGQWRYSNGNYCALGLVIEAVTGEPLDVAAQRLVFDPLGATGVHLTTGGLRPDDVPSPRGVERLSRLGGAGTVLASTDDLAAMLAATTPTDLTTLAWPGVLADQYGWGHTGTVDGAKSCAWVLEWGRTTVVATIAGNAPSSGGEVCDLVIPALAQDLGFPAGRPDRSPP